MPQRANNTQSHVWTMVVVGLGMVLIAGLAGLAAYAWTHRRPTLTTRKRASRSDDVLEAGGQPVAEA